MDDRAAVLTERRLIDPVNDGPVPSNSHVALVTGAGGRVGESIVERLAGEGWLVFASSRRGGENLLAADLRDPDQADRLVVDIIGRAGRLDALVHGAALDRRGRVDEQPVDEWWSVVETQLTGAFHIVRAAIGHLQRSGGSIVIVACEYGVAGRAGATAMSAAASGVIGLTRALAREFGPGVRTSCVAAGDLGPWETPPAGACVPRSELSAQANAGTIASTVAFLLGRDGHAFNGQVLHPNGGSTLV